MNNNFFKIAVLCDKTNLFKLQSCLNGATICTDYFSSGDDALYCLGKEDCDVILVDSLHNEAARVCRATRQDVRPPVALLVSGSSLNWGNYTGWDVDGFISEDAGSQEILARLKAIARRPAR